MDGHGTQSDDIRLADYLQALYRRRGPAAIAFAIVFLTVLVHTFVSTPIYQASALIQVKEETTQNQLLSDLAKLGKGSPVAAEMEILKSRTVSEGTVQALRLDVSIADADAGLAVRMENVDLDADHQGRPLTVRFLDDPRRFQVRDADRNVVGEGEVGQPFAHPGVSFFLREANAKAGQSFRLMQLPFPQAVEALQATLRVSRVGEDTNIVMVYYRHKNPVLARDVVNKVLAVYRQSNVDEKAREASQTLDFVEGQLKLIQNNLNASEEDLDRFKTEKGVMSLSAEAETTIENISKLELERSEIELQLFQAKALLRDVQAGRDISSSYALPNLNKDEVLLSSVAVQLAEKEVERKSLLEERTERDPAVAVLTAAIGDLRGKVEQILANTVKTLETRRASVEKIVGDYGKQLTGLPGIEKDLAALTRTTDVNANLYKFLLEKHEEARIAKAATVGNIRIIDNAETPTTPVRPKKKLNVLLGLVAGLILGSIVAFVLEYVDDSLKSLSEVERHVGQAIYGVVPRIPRDVEEGAPSILITRRDPKSPISEAFRTLRTNIQFAAPDRRVHSLLVTSAGPSEGKSTIVSNLSITIANLDIPTLLIDCDLRKPNLHNILSASRDPGLTNVIMGEVPWRDAVQTTAVTNLSFLPSGPIPPNPTELLGSQQMRELMEAVKAEFGIVLLDSPPVVAVTDAALLSSIVDGTLLVVELGRARAQAVNRAVDLLQNVQARLLGVVANNVVSTGFRYDYGYYAYYYSTEGGERRKARRRRGRR